MIHRQARCAFALLAGYLVFKSLARGPGRRRCCR